MLQEPYNKTGPTVVPYTPGGQQPYTHPAHGRGTFDFSEPSEYDAEANIHRFRWIREDGESWNLPIDEVYQGGRWEDSKHAASDFFEYKRVWLKDPAAFIGEAAKMWKNDPELQQVLVDAVKTGATFAELKSGLKAHNTWRTISKDDPIVGSGVTERSRPMEDYTYSDKNEDGSYVRPLPRINGQRPPTEYAHFTNESERYQAFKHRMRGGTKYYGMEPGSWSAGFRDLPPEKQEYWAKEQARWEALTYEQKVEKKNGGSGRGFLGLGQGSPGSPPWIRERREWREANPERAAELVKEADRFEIRLNGEEHAAFRQSPEGKLQAGLSAFYAEEAAKRGMHWREAGAMAWGVEQKDDKVTGAGRLGVVETGGQFSKGKEMLSYLYRSVRGGTPNAGWAWAAKVGRAAGRVSGTLLVTDLMFDSLANSRVGTWLPEGSQPLLDQWRRGRYEETHPEGDKPLNMYDLRARLIGEGGPQGLDLIHAGNDPRLEPQPRQTEARGRPNTRVVEIHGMEPGSQEQQDALLDWCLGQMRQVSADTPGITEDEAVRYVIGLAAMDIPDGEGGYIPGIHISPLWLEEMFGQHNREDQKESARRVNYKFMMSPKTPVLTKLPF